MIQISEEWMDKLIEMVKQGNEVHLEFTPEETRMDHCPGGGCHCERKIDLTGVTNYE